MVEVEVGSLVVTELDTTGHDLKLRKLLDEKDYREKAGFKNQAAGLNTAIQFLKADLIAKDLGYKKIKGPFLRTYFFGGGTDGLSLDCFFFTIRVNHKLIFGLTIPHRRRYECVQAIKYEGFCPRHIIESYRVAEAQGIFQRIYIANAERPEPDPYLLGLVYSLENRRGHFQLYLIDNWDEEEGIG